MCPCCPPRAPRDVDGSDEDNLAAEWPASPAATASSDASSPSLPSSASTTAAVCGECEHAAAVSAHTPTFQLFFTADDLLEGGPPEAEDKKNKEQQHDDPRAARTASLAATLRADPLLHPTAPAALALAASSLASQHAQAAAAWEAEAAAAAAASRQQQHHQRHRYAPLIAGDHDAEAPRVYHPYAAVSEDNNGNNNAGRRQTWPSLLFQDYSDCFALPPASTNFLDFDTDNEDTDTTTAMGPISASSSPLQSFEALFPDDSSRQSHRLSLSALRRSLSLSSGAQTPKHRSVSFVNLEEGDEDQHHRAAARTRRRPVPVHTHAPPAAGDHYHHSRASPISYISVALADKF
ncbi:uncharacterized protein LOC62_06G008477 [Vanrija pseudolonga]|uniref:Uncharacterized protein n=1 Tax=Vanrija pseudolonga TaxID=143232 RepID=A0AAF1BKR4_9TREE|nr:hypothetical protein LOC62_06G008477 [Vanrija pseudolonga]